MLAFESHRELGVHDEGSKSRAPDMTYEAEINLKSFYPEASGKTIKICACVGGGVGGGEVGDPHT